MRRLAASGALICLLATAVVSASAQTAPVPPSDIYGGTLAWSADGSRLFFAVGEEPLGAPSNDRFVVNADGSGLERPTSDVPGRSDGRYVRAPDGRPVAFLRNAGQALFLVDARGNERLELAQGAGCVALSPDARFLAYADANGLSIADTSTGEAQGAPGARCPSSWSSDFTKLSWGDRIGMYIYDRALARVVYGSDGCCYNASGPAFSPDGTRAAFAAASTDRGDDAPSVYVVDLRAGKARELAGVWGGNVVSWSPDGTRLAYGSNGGVFMVDSDGTDRRLFLPDVWYIVFSPDWSHYAFGASAGDGYDLYVARTGSGAARRIGPSQCTEVREPCIALDGGNDRRSGGRGRDIILGGFGDDRIMARGGNDRLDGELGDDRLEGEAGNDELHGGFGRDRLVGGPGNDVLLGNEGVDVIYGGAGADKIEGRFSPDRVFAGPGNDRVFTSDGSTTRVVCGTGRDVIRADKSDLVARDCERVLPRHLFGSKDK